MPPRTFVELYIQTMQPDPVGDHGNTISMDSSGNSSGFLGDPMGSPGNPMGFHGVFNKIPWNPIRFLGDPGGIPSDPNGGSKFQVGNTAFLRGGGKSGKKMFFLAHPPLGDPPGPLGGSFQRGHQNTPISILKLPFEHLSSWVFPWANKVGNHFPMVGVWGRSLGELHFLDLFFPGP